ncbi:MAG TPA: hypothetical protein DDW50_06305 [Firmicutes bacterium]|nr:hypothetical protein [Bacillota bacterium]
MRKIAAYIGITVGLIGCIGLIFWVREQRQSSEKLSIKDTSLWVEENLPFGIERNNPVPEVKHWDFEKRTYYYFNWGLKNTGGYSLEVMDVQEHIIKIKAQSPRRDQLRIEALTFPSLLLSLPQGHYRYKVVNEKGERMGDIFLPPTPPLKLTVFVPKENGQIARREVLRNAACRFQGKPVALIALESLFNQDEVQNFTSRGIIPEKVIWEQTQRLWTVQLSKNFETLNPDEKKLLCEMIRKTVLALTSNSAAPVEIVSDSQAATAS